MKVFQEFKEFAIKGNMVDMAVGIIIGAASSEVISSLVEDIIMPPLGFFLGKVSLSDLRAVVLSEQLGEDGVVIQPEIAIEYGHFIQVTIDFLIMAWALFLVIKFFNMLRRMAEDQTEKTVPTPRDIELLASIDDTLSGINEKLTMNNQ
jgi:large conductance mechanosensitive channel